MKICGVSAKIMQQQGGRGSEWSELGRNVEGKVKYVIGCVCVGDRGVWCMGGKLYMALLVFQRTLASILKEMGSHDNYIFTSN